MYSITYLNTLTYHTMKKLFYPLILCAAAVAVLGCEKEPAKTTTYKLEVSTLALNFKATAAAAQTVTVTAENVEWEVITGEDANWVTVTPDEENSTITVSVTDNTTETERTAQIQVAPVANDSVEAQTVTIKQAAKDGESEPTDVTMKLSSNSAKLLGAGGQEVITVTFEGTDEKLPFTVTPDAECDWLTIDVNVETGEVTLGAALNDDTVSRSIMLTVAAENENIAPKKISVSQEAGATGKIELTVFFPLNFRWDETASKQAKVTLTGLTEFGARIENEDGTECEWAHVRQRPYGSDGTQFYVEVWADNNMTLVARKAYLVLEATAEGESATPVRQEITQEAGKEGLSTLTGDVELPAFSDVKAYVTPYNDPEAMVTSPWAFTFMTEDLEYNVWGNYVGTGTLVRFTLQAPAIPFDEDEKNYSYTLQDGEYKGVVRVSEYGAKYEPFTFAQGDNGGINASAWIQKYENDVLTEAAPLFGAIETLNTGENSYIIKFDLTDDMGHTITGSWEGTLSELREQGMREPSDWDNDGSGVDDGFDDPVVDPEL